MTLVHCALLRLTIALARFTMANVICIAVYSMQLVVGLAVNSYSLVYLLRERMALHNKNRMILLLIHLTCADLFVSNLTLFSFS